MCLLLILILGPAPKQRIWLTAVIYSSLHLHYVEGYFLTIFSNLWRGLYCHKKRSPLASTKWLTVHSITLYETSCVHSALCFSSQKLRAGNHLSDTMVAGCYCCCVLQRTLNPSLIHIELHCSETSIVVIFQVI